MCFQLGDIDVCAYYFYNSIPAEDVTGLNASIPASNELGADTVIGVEAASGTDVNVTCSFGDGTDDYVRSYAVSHLL